MIKVNAKKVRTKLFYKYDNTDAPELDEQINSWLGNNPGLDLCEIKYQTAVVSPMGDICHSALVIYYNSHVL